MIEETAIRRIEQLAASQINLAGVPADMPAVVIPNDCHVEDLERHLEQPRRMRAKFNTARLTDLLKYVTPQHDGLSAIFIDDDGSGVKAILDYGTAETPLWEDHVATMTCRETPAFDALQKMTQSGVSQRAITDWIEDWREIIEACDSDGQQIPLAKAIASIRRVDIKASRESTHTDGDMAMSQSSLDQIAASSDGDSLPAFFRVTTPVFEDLDERELRVRLALKAVNDKPQFGLRIIAKAQVMREIADEIETKVKRELPEARVYVGNA